MSRRFAINYPDVVAEAIEGEYIAVNLDTGTYYSLEGAAAVLWPLLSSGVSLEEIEAMAGRLFVDAPSEFGSDLRRLADELLTESILREGAPGGPEAAELPMAPAPYRAPAVGIHADLQDILLLDPVHDVDDAGWPVAGDPNAGHADRA